MKSKWWKLLDEFVGNQDVSVLVMSELLYHCDRSISIHFYLMTYSSSQYHYHLSPCLNWVYHLKRIHVFWTQLKYFGHSSSLWKTVQVSLRIHQSRRSVSVSKVSRINGSRITSSIITTTLATTTPITLTSTITTTGHCQNKYY